MAEYIERDAAVQAIKELLERPGISDGISLGVQLRILALPTADVAPVRHGRWLLVRPGEWTAAMKCSKCGRRISVNPKEVNLEKDYPFCHCGAKMDKVRD